MVRDVPAEHMTAEQAALLTEAVKLYQGDLVTGWYQDWCFLERERYQSMLLAMLDKVIDYCVVQQQFEQGIEFAMQVLRYDQARERSHRRLMRLYYLADNRTAALRQYELCATALERELDVQPSQKTTALYQQIRADNGRVLGPSSLFSAPPTTNSKPEVGMQVIALLQSLHADMLTMQQDMNSLRQALTMQKDASADT
jgi:DNA-binding SARP family transcriptional activator